MATATTVNHAHIDASAYVLTCLQHFFGVLLFCYSSFDCGLHSLRLSDIEKITLNPSLRFVANKRSSLLQRLKAVIYDFDNRSHPNGFVSRGESMG